MQRSGEVGPIMEEHVTRNWEYLAFLLLVGSGQSVLAFSMYPDAVPGILEYVERELSVWGCDRLPVRCDAECPSTTRV